MFFVCATKNFLPRHRYKKVAFNDTKADARTSSEPSIRPITFCSISSLSHLARTAACLRSLIALHPHASYRLLVIDGDAAQSIDIQDIVLLRPIDCINDQTLANMRASYSIAELCFAAKPFLLKTLLSQGANQVHYLDGDCLALGSLSPLFETLATSDVLLTPHCLSPVPDDGLTPRPLTMLRAGAYNGGYIGVRNTSQGRAFTQWLASMTSKFGYNQPKNGMCGDQRWLDLAPVLFPGTAICRHPGANVAYWNLHERELQRAGNGDFSVAEHSLLFFHFSGYESQRPGELSRYQSRHAVVPGSPLDSLLEIYKASIETSLPVSLTRRQKLARAGKHFMEAFASLPKQSNR